MKWTFTIILAALGDNTPELINTMAVGSIGGLAANSTATIPPMLWPIIVIDESLFL
jgi:hypothetical protein